MPPRESPCYETHTRRDVSSGDKISARMEEGRGVHRVLVGKPAGKRPLGSSRRRWEDNIKMGLREARRLRTVWIYLAEDRDR